MAHPALSDRPSRLYTRRTVPPAPFTPPQTQLCAIAKSKPNTLFGTLASVRGVPGSSQSSTGGPSAANCATGDNSSKSAAAAAANQSLQQNGALGTGSGGGGGGSTANAAAANVRHRCHISCELHDHHLDDAMRLHQAMLSQTPAIDFGSINLADMDPDEIQVSRASHVQLIVLRWSECIINIECSRRTAPRRVEPHPEDAAGALASGSRAARLPVRVEFAGTNTYSQVVL